MRMLERAAGAGGALRESVYFRDSIQGIGEWIVEALPPVSLYDVIEMDIF